MMNTLKLFLLGGFLLTALMLSAQQAHAIELINKSKEPVHVTIAKVGCFGVADGDLMVCNSANLYPGQSHRYKPNILLGGSGFLVRFHIRDRGVKTVPNVHKNQVVVFP